MDKNARLTYMDMVKGIAIILVVIGHSTVASDNVVTWLASFHMPLFFIISGMLFYIKQSQTEKFKEYFFKRFRGMMIPYFVFSAYNILLFYYQSARYPDIKTPEFIKDSYLQAFSFYGISVLWFLPAIFFAELIFFGLMKKLPKWAVAVIVLVLSFIPAILKPQLDIFLPDTVATIGLRFLRYLLYAILRIPTAVAFLGIGYSSGWLKGIISKKKPELKAYIEVLVGILLMALNAVIAFTNGRVDMHYVVQGNPVLFHIGAASATFGLLLIFKHMPKLKLLNYLGANSLIVMLTHLDCQVVSYGLLFATKVDTFITHAKVYLYYFNMALFILVAELVIIYVMNRWLFFLLGKKHAVK